MSKYNPDWDSVKADVCNRIDLLRATYENMEGPIAEKIFKDLILPCMELLGQFCACVKIEEETEDAE